MRVRWSRLSYLLTCLSSLAIPRLAHSHSQQSVAASEDYYSLHDQEEEEEESDESDPFHNNQQADLLAPPGRPWTTPPSRYHTPDDERPIAVARAQDSAPQFAAPVRSQRPHGAFEVVAIPAQNPVMEPGLRRKPVPAGSPINPRYSQHEPLLSSQEQRTAQIARVVGGPNLKPSTVDMRAAQTTSPALTENIDDTPYIQFALDQLTRDEEVRGTSRRYPSRRSLGPVATADRDSGVLGANAPLLATVDPVQRQSQRSSGRPLSSLPADLPAVAPLLAEDEIEEVEDEPHFPTDRYSDPFVDPVIRRQQPPPTYANVARDKELAIGTAPLHPLQQQQLQQQNPFTPNTPPSGRREQYDVFVPYTPTAYSNITPKLNALPGILRPIWLGIYLLLCTLFLACLIFSAAYSRDHQGLWDYGSFGDGRYFVLQYLPTLLGMILLLWLLQIQIAVKRVAPFMAMASSTTARSQAGFLHLYPSQFLLPNLQYFRAGQPIIGIAFLEFWAHLFTIPLLGSAYNVQYFAGWRWVAVQGVMWTLVALYIIHILTVLLLAVGYLWRNPTGLKWDARCIADYIALLERTNTVNDYSNSETFAHIGQFKQRLWNRSDRLGYWHTSRRPQDIFYGIGEEGGPTRRYSIEQGRIREKAPRGLHSNQSSISSMADIEAAAATNTPGQALVPTNPDVRDSHVRTRTLPFFLRTPLILVWIAIAIILFLAFLIVAFVNSATLLGFIPALAAAANSAGFSAANFLYSFVPGIIGMILFLLFQPLDYAFRRLQPFANLSNSPEGALAEHSLLLDYPYKLPFLVSLSAISNRDWQVAALSFVAVVNAVIPVLAGGIFWAQWYPNAEQVRIAAQPAGLYALCFFLALYAFSLLLLLPGRKAIRLPHGATCLSEIISWLYMSPILVDRAFSRCNTRAEMVARLLPATTEQGNQLRQKKSFWQSVTSLLTAKNNNDRPVERAGPLFAGQTDTLGAYSAPVAQNERDPRLSAVPEDEVPSRTRAATGGAQPPVTAEKLRYGFGVYVGRDGKEHLGIDRVRRDGRSMTFIGEDVERKRGRDMIRRGRMKR